MENKILLRHINTIVLPQYLKNDEGHGIDHAVYVINRSLGFAEGVTPINTDMVHTVAAYHDIGHHIDKYRHEEISAEILADDKRLKEFFDTDSILTMANAVEDHRANLEYPPRSVYGKIVSSADRRVDLDDILRSTYTWITKTEPQASVEMIIDDAWHHIQGKYGNGGYGRTALYFADPEYQKMLDEIAGLLNDKQKFIEKYYRVNDIDLSCTL